MSFGRDPEAIYQDADIEMRALERTEPAESCDDCGAILGREEHVPGCRELEEEERIARLEDADDRERGLWPPEL